MVKPSDAPKFSLFSHTKVVQDEGCMFVFQSERYCIYEGSQGQIFYLSFQSASQAFLMLWKQ